MKNEKVQNQETKPTVVGKRYRHAAVADSSSIHNRRSRSVIGSNFQAQERNTMSRAKKKYRQRRRSEKPPKELPISTREQLIVRRISSEYSRYGRTDRDGKLL